MHLGIPLPPSIIVSLLPVMPVLFSIMEIYFIVKLILTMRFINKKNTGFYLHNNNSYERKSVFRKICIDILNFIKIKRKAKLSVLHCFVQLTMASANKRSLKTLKRWLGIHLVSKALPLQIHKERGVREMKYKIELLVILNF